MRTFLIILFLFLVACNKTPKVPDNVLPVPKMTNVLWDMMLADELVAQQVQVDTGNIRMDTSMILYSQIAEAHKTSQQQFKQSLDYYKTRPDLVKVILDTLNNRATAPSAPAQFNKDSLSAQ